MISYNQEAYIQKSLESVVQQQHDFEWELIIGDDASTDDTPNIINRYADQYPQIKPRLRKQNLGPLKNFMDVISSAKGEYVCFLEGDDYWSDNEKIKKQIDFFSTHPDYAICFTNMVVYYQNEDEYKDLITSEKPEIQMEELLERNHVTTQTCMFRNHHFDFPKGFENLKMGDWPLHMMNATKGRIGHLNEFTAVYRVHDAGIFSGASLVQRDLNVVDVYELMKTWLPAKYEQQISGLITKLFYKIALRYMRNKDFSNAKTYVRKYRSRVNVLTDLGSYKLIAHRMLKR